MDFTPEHYKALENQSLHGEKASAIKDGADWAWIKEFLLGAMTDQAVNVLKNSKTEEDRLKAQQMFLAADKPIQLLDFLISQGDAARASLMEVTSTLDNNEEEQKNA